MVWYLLKGALPMNMERFLARIGFRGELSVDKPTLDKLMAAHINSVTFENLDQQLGHPVTMGLEDIYRKVVEQRRGGWCFELNGLFGWALREIGFEVDYLAGQVGRRADDPEFLADHMLLRVNLDLPLLVDVGFGCGLASSLPFAPNAQLQAPYNVSVSQLDKTYLRYSEHVRGEPATYDFTMTSVDRSYFDPACHRLQTDPQSPFLRTLTAQKRLGDQHLILRGLVLLTVARDANHDQILKSKEELVGCLKNLFGLEVPEIAEIWPSLVQRHEVLFGST